MLQLALTVSIYLLIVIPAGVYLYHIAAGKHTFADPVFDRVDGAIYKISGVDPGKGMNMGLFEILFGFQKQPTDDLEFRRAVRYALNYELLATTIGGEDGQVPGEGIISPQVLATMTAFPSW